MSVSLVQPMREAEIELVKLANANEANIAQEILDRKTAYNTLQNNINAEANAREAADTALQNKITAEATARNQEDSKLQSGIDEINAKFPVATDSIADNAITSNKIADGTISAIELDSSIQNQLSFLASLPAIEFGTSDSFDIQASSYYDCTVTFNTKTTIPIVLCGLQHETGNMACTITSVTNQQFSARVFNLTATDIKAAKIDWLAISGR